MGKRNFPFGFTGSSASLTRRNQRLYLRIRQILRVRTLEVLNVFPGYCQAIQFPG